MATQEQKQALTALYVGYYDRAPDPDGLQFWIDQIDNGREFSTIAADFAAAPEALAKYPYLSTPDVSTPSTFITSIYLNLFGRTPDQAGLDFWTGVLNDGSVSVAEMIEEIIMGAVNDEDAGTFDKTVLDNKIEVGLDFAESTADVSGFEFDADAKMAAEAAVNGVTEDPATVEAAKAATDAYLAGETNQGDTLTLTTGIDAFDGTDADDTFNAGIALQDPTNAASIAQTLTAIDEVSGGEGVDRLNARLIDSSADGVVVDGVEQLYLRSTNLAATLDMSGVTGAEQVWSDRSTANLSVSEIQNEVVLGVKEGNGSDFTAAYATGATSADFTQSVVLQNADIDELSVTDADGNITGLAVNVTGADVELDLDGDLEAVTSLTVEGDAGLDLTPGNDLGDLETLTSTTTGDVAVDAGNVLETASFGEGDDVLNTGGAAVETITMGAGDDAVRIWNTDLADDASVDLGEGDDRLDLGANFDAANSATLDGGEGNDTLALSSAKAAELSADGVDFDQSFSNFEELEIGFVAAGETSTVDMSNMNDITEVVTTGVAAGAVNAPAEAEEHVFTVASGADADGGSFFLNGVEITVAGGATASDVADAITAAFDNGDFAGVAEIDNIDNTGDTVTVTYTEAAGDVADDFLEFEENPASSGVEFSNNSVDTAGTAPVQEVQSFDVTAGTDADGGTIQYDIGNDGTQQSTTLQGNLTQDEVAAALAADIAADPRVASTTVSGATVTINYVAAEGNIDTIDFGAPATNDTGATVANVTEDTQGDAGADGTQTFNIDTGTDADGGNIVVAGVSITLGANLSVDQVGVAITDAFANGDFAGTDVTNVSYDTANDEVTLTLDKDNAPYAAALDVNDDSATSTVDLDLDNVVVDQFVPADADADGVLTIDNLASEGTVELTANVAGELVVNVTDAGLAASTDDVVNLRLNGTNNIVAMVQVANVETVNIETTNSDADNLPTATSAVNLQASAAETVTIAGNQGVNLFGDLSSMTLLDASGVQASESTLGADDAGTVGAVSIANGAADADVTILTGNGDDFINATFVGTGTVDDVAATIDAGAGDDAVLGSDGGDTIDLGEGDDVVVSSGASDTITLGAGNDTYVLDATADSTISVRDMITDFSANTVGQGAGGAVDGTGAAAMADRDGDVIDLDMFGLVGGTLSVDVFANAADASTFLGNNDANGEINIALDSSTGYLYIDTDDDGIANSVVELQGVTTIDEAAFTF